MIDRPTDELTVRRRRLPHWQLGGSAYFLTFCSARGDLPEETRPHVVTTILYDHGRRYDLYLAVVMPDHVHLLVQPREVAPGRWCDLTEITRAIKGVSARRINEQLGTTGRVWQQESFDRLIRDDAEFLQKWEYIWHNPVKAGLAERPEQYPWFVTPEPQ